MVKCIKGIQSVFLVLCFRAKRFSLFSRVDPSSGYPFVFAIEPVDSATVSQLHWASSSEHRCKGYFAYSAPQTQSSLLCIRYTFLFALPIRFLFPLDWFSQLAPFGGAWIKLDLQPMQVRFYKFIDMLFTYLQSWNTIEVQWFSISLMARTVNVFQEIF